MAGFSPRRARLWLCGKQAEGVRDEEIRSPFDGALAGTAAVAGDSELEAAVAFAVRGFAQMRREPRHRRAKWCRAVAEGIRSRAEEFAEIIMRETGKPIQFARGEANRAVSTFLTAAGEAERFGGAMVPLDITAAGEGYSGFVLRVPAGPVAAISPFNFPLNLSAHKVAPALALGVPVVLKPPPQAPLTVSLLAEVVADAGAPAEALQVLHMPVNLAERLATDARLPVLSFTGSARVGWHLKGLVPRKKVVLELGGDAPAIVHEDADLAYAAARCAVAAYGSAGQVCIKVQRMLVHERVYDDFLARFVEAARGLPVGDPADDRTVVGPLIDPGAADRVEEWVEEAVAAGARVLLRGGRRGNFVDPVLLENVPRHVRLGCEEVFGPVATVESYADFDDAIGRANASRYGLQAGVFTQDLSRAGKAAAELEFGGVMINDVPAFRVDNFPYGGVKDSGFGREGVVHAMAEMCDTRMVAVRL